MLLYFTSKYTATAFLTEMFFPKVLNQVGKLRKLQGGGGFKTKVPSMEGGGGMDIFFGTTPYNKISKKMSHRLGTRKG